MLLGKGDIAAVEKLLQVPTTPSPATILTLHGTCMYPSPPWPTFHTFTFTCEEASSTQTSAISCGFCVNGDTVLQHLLMSTAG